MVWCVVGFKLLSKEEKEKNCPCSLEGKISFDRKAKRRVRARRVESSRVESSRVEWLDRKFTRASTDRRDGTGRDDEARLQPSETTFEEEVGNIRQQGIHTLSSSYARTYDERRAHCVWAQQLNTFQTLALSLTQHTHT